MAIGTNRKPRRGRGYNRGLSRRQVPLDAYQQKRKRPLHGAGESTSSKRFRVWRFETRDVWGGMKLNRLSPKSFYNHFCNTVFALLSKP